MLALLALLAAACGGGDATTTGDTATGDAADAGSATEGGEDATEGGEEAAADLGEILLVQSAENVAFLPTYVADAKGFWEAEGLTVEVRELADNSAINAALIAGEAQAAASQSDGPIRALLSGAPDMWLAANLTSRPTMQFVLRKGVLDDKGITVEQWEAMSYDERTEVFPGLKFGTFGPGGLIDSVVTAVISDAGLTDADITRVTVGGAAETFAALKAGTIDVMALSPPHPFQAIREGFGVRIGDTSDVSEQLSEFAYESLSLLKSWTEENPQVAEALGHGFANACNYARETDPETLADDLQGAGWFAGFEREVLVDSLAATQDAVPPSCKITQESIDNLVAVNVAIEKFTEEELADFSLSEGELYTNEFLE